MLQTRLASELWKHGIGRATRGQKAKSFGQGLDRNVFFCFADRNRLLPASSKLRLKGQLWVGAAVLSSHADGQGRAHLTLELCERQEDV